MTPAPSTLSTSTARSTRIVFAGHPMGIELQRDPGSPSWTWAIVGTCVSRGHVALSTDELVAFGARLAALIGGVRTSAELVSRCGRVRLSTSVDRRGYAVAFRVADVGAETYSAGQMVMSETSLVRAADALLVLFEARAHAS